MFHSPVRSRIWDTQLNIDVWNMELLQQRLNKGTQIITLIKLTNLEYLQYLQRQKRCRIPQIKMEGEIGGRRISRLKYRIWLYRLTSTTLFLSAANKVKVVLVITHLIGERHQKKFFIYISVCISIFSFISFVFEVT